MNYTTTEKKALAMLKAMRYFRSYLKCFKFKLFTDHQALTFLLKMTELKGMIAHWINELQQLDFKVTHRPGGSLKDSDAISRFLVPTSADSPEAVNSSKSWEGTKHPELETHGKNHGPSIIHGSSDS